MQIASSAGAVVRAAWFAVALCLGANAIPASAQDTAMVRAVQRGHVDFDGVNTRTIPISPVDPAKSIVLGSWRADSASPQSLPTFELDAGGANVIVTTTAPGTAAWVAEWQVIEFFSGVSVERGTAAFGAADLTVPVTLTGAVNGKSFPILSTRCDSTSIGDDDQWTVTADIAGPVMTLQRFRADPSLVVAWQVATLTLATDSVLKGTATIPGNTQFVNVTVPAIDPASSFLLFTRREITAGSSTLSRGSESRYQIRARTVSPTQLTFDRGVLGATSTSVAVVYYLVTISGISVQSGNVSFNTASTAVAAQIAAPGVDPGRTALFTSTRTASLTGNANSPTDQLGDTSVTAALDDAQNLTFLRILSSVAANNIGADTTWSAVRFPPLVAISTATSVTPSADHPVFGQPLSFTATVQAVNDPGTPTGSVAFSDGTSPLGNASLIDGHAVLATNALTLGAHFITATYLGDATYVTSTSAPLSLTITTAGTRTTLSAPATSNYGDPVVLNASVDAAPPATGTPAGMVEFFDGAASLGTVALDAAGKAAWTALDLRAGTHTVTARYLGSDNHAASDSPQAAIKITGVAVTVSVFSIGVRYSESDQRPILFATVTSDGKSVKFGSGLFQVSKDGNKVGSAVAGDLDPSGNTAATYPLPDGTPPGDYTITYSYSGAAQYEPGSGSNTLTISPYEVFVYVEPTETVYKSLDQELTLTAHVSSGFQTPVGSGLFQITTGATDVGSAVVATLDETGTATAKYTLPAGTPVGEYWITYSYYGTSLFESSSGRNFFRITQTQPVIIWPKPARIFEGAKLSELQLNPAAHDPESNTPLAGSFRYFPTPGSVLSAGLNQPLNAFFSPDDTKNYTGAVANNTIDVDPAIRPAITSALNATATKDAPFSYTITADGSAPLQYYVEVLPPGLSSAGAEISGTPAASGVFYIPLAVQNYGGGDFKYLKLVVLGTGTNHAPEHASPPAASPNPALAGMPVTFSAQASDVDGDILDYTWNFGDGTSATGTTVTKSYTVAGVYIVTVNVSDGQTQSTQALNLIVQDQPAIGILSVDKVRLAFNFAKGSKDSLTILGKLQVPSGFNPAGAGLRVLIGSLDVSTTLDSKGRSADRTASLKIKKGSASAKFSFALKNRDLFAKLESLGFSKTQSNPAVNMPVTAMLGNVAYLDRPAVKYSAKSNKAGPITGKGKK